VSVRQCVPKSVTDRPYSRYRADTDVNQSINKSLPWHSAKYCHTGFYHLPLCKRQCDPVVNGIPYTSVYIIIFKNYLPHTVSLLEDLFGLSSIQSTQLSYPHNLSNYNLHVSALSIVLCEEDRCTRPFHFRHICYTLQFFMQGFF